MGGDAVKRRCTAIVFDPRGKPQKCGAAASGQFCAHHDAMFVTVQDRPQKAVSR